MKILVLNYEFPPLGGGASPVSYEIAKGYADRGHTVHVVTMGYKDLPKEERIGNMIIYRVPCLRFKKELCRIHEMASFVISAVYFLNKKVKRERYDICHTHFIIPTGLVAFFIKKMFGLKYVITAHGSDVPGYNNDRFTLAHKFTNLLLKKICHQAEIIITPSNYLAGLIVKNINPYLAGKIIKIPNGIYPDHIIPLDKKKVIVSTGRLLPRKGFQYLIEAFSYEDLGYEIHILGDGPIMPQLKQMANRSRTKIIFHGWLDNRSNKYKEILGSAAIFCLASLKENASVSLLEAMSAGCAVVTTNIAGCPETVGKAGILVKPADSRDLREKIYQLVRNPNALIGYQKSARERIIKSFNNENVLNLYENIITRSSQISRI